MHTGRIHAGHHMTHQAVFARRVTTLKDDEETLAGLGHQPMLMERHLPDHLGQFALGRVLVPAQRFVRRPLR